MISHEIKKWLNNQRSLHKLNINIVSLNALPNWKYTKKNIHHISNRFFKIDTVQVEDGFQEYLLRVPVLLNENTVLDEGILSKSTILKNYLFS